MHMLKLWAETFFVALRLGLTSFGGPIAHLGYFHREYVDRRKWLSEEEYADLVALCQLLPGPASSQIGFAIGMKHAGLVGGLLAWIGFTLPSAAIMIAFAMGVTQLDALDGAGWLKGLKVAAVAVVAEAVWKMANKLCPDRSRVSIAIGAATLLLLSPMFGVARIWAQVGLILAGAVIGVFAFRDATMQPALHAGGPTRKLPVLLGVGGFFLLLFLFPLLAKTTGNQVLAYVDSFYRSGALVFGGGHVVLPLLEAEVVESGWMTRDIFVAGYGGAQAIPGPLFAFSAYLGAAMNRLPNGILGGVLCLCAIYLPSLLLVIGVLPVWERLCRSIGVKAALAGTNAVVVGILMAAFYDPVWKVAILDAPSFATALVAALLLFTWKWPSWAVVLSAAGIGQLIL